MGPSMRKHQLVHLGHAREVPNSLPLWSESRAASYITRRNSFAGLQSIHITGYFIAHHLPFKDRRMRKPGQLDPRLWPGFVVPQLANLFHSHWLESPLVSDMIECHLDTYPVVYLTAIRIAAVITLPINVFGLYCVYAKVSPICNQGKDRFRHRRI